jgi:hypothetical protein
VVLFERVAVAVNCTVAPGVADPVGPLTVTPVTVGVVVVGAVGVELPPPAAEAASSKTWLDRRQALEDYLKIAEAIKMEEIGLGVTKPRRAYLAPGGLVDRMAWKTIRPGIHEGFWESYKSEIAAYELDKLLGLDMVPPTVERRVKGEIGAAVMWISSSKSFKDLGSLPHRQF